MAGVNRYYRFSKLSEAKFRQIVRCFANDLTATETAKVTRLSVRSVNAIFIQMRWKMAAVIEHFFPNGAAIEKAHLQGLISRGQYFDLRYRSHARRMDKFCGIREKALYFHVKETEFRLVFPEPAELYKFLLFLFKVSPL